jgi:hypothetical protein
MAVMLTTSEDMISEEEKSRQKALLMEEANAKVEKKL